jgi:hypothetical protein
MKAYAPTRITVDSSSIAAIGFSADAQLLDVQFRRGPSYRYFHVPYEVFAAFLAAPSKGRFFNTYVRPSFAHQRL